MTWFDLAHVTALWYMGPDPPSKKDLFLVSWVPWAGSLQLPALFGNYPCCREPVYLRSLLFMGLPIFSDLSVQGYKAVLLPTLGQLWRSFQLQLWLDLNYNSASPFLPLFYKCWSHCLFLINLLQEKPISVSESWKTQSETPHPPNSICPLKPFFSKYLTSIGLKQHILDDCKYKCEKWVFVWRLEEGCLRLEHQPMISFAVWNQPNFEI